MFLGNMDGIEFVRFSYKLFVGNSLIISIHFNWINDKNMYCNEKKEVKMLPNVYDTQSYIHNS